MISFLRRLLLPWRQGFVREGLGRHGRERWPRLDRRHYLAVGELLCALALELLLGELGLVELVGHQDLLGWSSSRAGVVRATRCRLETFVTEPFPPTLAARTALTSPSPRIR